LGGGSPKGKSYAAGGTVVTPAVGKPSSAASYDSAAARAQRQQESQIIYEKGQAPKPQYTERQNNVRTIDPKDQRIEELRRQLDHERLMNREVRRDRIFTPYYSRPVVVYQDPYSSFFWWWLLDQSLDQRSYWVYHHRDVMDQARYNALLAKDGQLEARLRDLEAKGTPRDPKYSPAGVDDDLMYTTNYVEAAYNPQAVTVSTNATSPLAVAPARPKAPARRVFGVMVTIMSVGVCLSFAVWLVFFKRWNF
jgi:hypothetical protein